MNYMKIVSVYLPLLYIEHKEYIEPSDQCIKVSVSHALFSHESTKCSNVVFFFSYLLKMYILLLQVWLSKLLTGWPSTDGNYELLNSEQNIKTNYLEPVENDQKARRFWKGIKTRKKGMAWEKLLISEFLAWVAVWGSHSAEMWGRVD